ncbi:MAG: FemAB family XrtA/PEP-CTERM system-associated protein [Pseudomonadota bacterium]
MNAPSLNPCPVAISIDTNCDRAAWDAYVGAHAEGTFFHLSGWGAAALRAYKYETHHITARRGDEIVGVLALCDVRSPLLGRSLVSTAFSVGGGPLADDDEARSALIDAAVYLAESERIKHIECRTLVTANHWREKAQTHARFAMPLIKDDADALAAIPRKRRAEIRKTIEAADQGELVIRFDRDLDVFYALYAKSLRRLGTPVFPRSFLDALSNEFSDRFEVAIADYAGAPVAALVSFYFRDTVLPYYVGASDKARQSRAFDFLYWSIMRRAAAKGMAVFDFGRSKIDSGAYAYKKLWGIEPAPLTYSIRPVAASSVPNVSPTNPKFALFSSLWPRLPLSVTNRLGPILAPNFP